jgi:RNA polymerase sigma factor (sigma-70 family)
MVEDAARWNAVWQHRHALMRAALRRTATVEDAEDVVQEAMTRAIESCRADDEGLAPWLMRVTVRLCVDTHRERVREQRRWVRLPVPAEVVPFDDRLCDRAEAAWAAGELARLPERQASALRLRAEGHSVAEVAERLGVNYRTAESLLARARSTLRAALASSLALAVALWRCVVRAARLGLTSPGVVAAAAFTVTSVAIAAQGPAVPLASNADRHHISRPSVQRVTAVPPPWAAPTAPSPAPTGLMPPEPAYAALPRAVPTMGREGPVRSEPAPGPMVSDNAEVLPLIAPPLPITGGETDEALSVPPSSVMSNLPAAPTPWHIGSFCPPRADGQERGPTPSVMECQKEVDPVPADVRCGCVKERTRRTSLSSLTSGRSPCEDERCSS